MKILLLCGSHPRHEFILRDIITQNPEIIFDVVLMQREELLPDYPKKDMNPTSNQLRIFKNHFKKREIIEKDIFGTKDISTHAALRNITVTRVSRGDINSDKTKLLIQKKKYDACIVMGFGMLTLESLALLPEETFNIHLGLSPKYRGSATLFWPTYLLDPFSTGVTFHRMVTEPDAGPILHQCVPQFQKNFSLHETAVAAITAAKLDLTELFRKLLEHGSLASVPQPTVGKTFLVSDFRIAHLEVIYEHYNDKVIDYLWPKDGNLPLAKLRKPNFL